MTLSKISWFLILALAACSSGQRNNLSADSMQKTKPKDTAHYADLYPLVIQNLKKKNITQNGSYYMLTPFSDSTVKITWGNDTIKRVYVEPLDFMFAERLGVKWENKEYLILNYNTGSGAWLNIVLPLNNKQQVREFSNVLCFDNRSNLFVTEEFTHTVLAIHNLKTQQNQFIIEKERPCDAQNSYCIDTVSISKNELYYKWVTPNKFADKKMDVEKRVRVTI